MSFNLIRSAGGSFVTDPRLLPRYSIPITGLYRSTATGVQNSDSATFFAGAANSINREAGSFQANPSWTVWAANTYRTMHSIASGGGFVANLFSPDVSAAQLFTFRITVDGTQYEVPIAVQAAGYRAVLGYLMPLDAFHAAANYGHDFSGMSDDGLTSKLSAGVALGANDPRMTIMLRFESSLLVEGKVQTSASGSSSTSEYNGGIIRRTL